MMNLQKLQGMGFKEDIVQPYGRCVIVPGDKFDPDWEVDLGDQGHKCFEALLNMKPVMLVQVEKKPAGSETKEVYTPQRVQEPQTPGKNRFKPNWSPEEEAYLIELHSRGDLTYGQIAERIHARFPQRSPGSVSNHIFALQKEGKLKHSPKEKELLQPWSDPEDTLFIELWKKHINIPQMLAKFPNRNHGSLTDHASELQKRGIIKPRWRKGEGKRQREKVEKKEHAEKTEEIPKSIPTEIPTQIPTPPLVTKDPVVKLLEEIRDLLKPQTYCFDYHCRGCGENGNVADSEKVWEFCPACGKPLIVWNVEA